MTINLLIFVVASVLLTFETPLVQGGIRYKDFKGSSYNVTYDDRSFLLNGTRVLFLSGSFHYARATPGMWPYIFDQMVEDGLNMVETYVFWNLHEFKRGQPYNFEGIANISSFLELAGEKNLFVNLRFGPYVCAEWNYGGLPVWLNNITGMKPRTHDPHWESEMERFLKDMVKVVEPHLARNGGPIVLAQIENEFHGEDPEYLSWCGKLTKSLDIGIPWGMCNGESAPETINTCNGRDCAVYADGHYKSHSGQPLVWTEDAQWFQQWSASPDSDKNDRNASSVAYAMLRWFARGGSHHNYYMWYGGNNFGSWMGSSITQMYANGGIFHSGMQPNEPKHSHLKHLHHQLSAISETLLNCPVQANKQFSLSIVGGKISPLLIGYAYADPKTKHEVIFLENDSPQGHFVQYDNHITVYFLPPKSITVVDTNGTTFFNSSDVPQDKYERCYVTTNALANASWCSFVDTWEDVEPAVPADHPLEQLSVTQDESDYLFYSTTLSMAKAANVTIKMHVYPAGAFMFFGTLQSMQELVNDDHSKFNDTTMLEGVFELPSGTVNLTILSVSFGIPNSGGTGYIAHKGIIGDLSFSPELVKVGRWVHRGGLYGEALKIYDPYSSSNVSWTDKAPTAQPLTWYKTKFKTPPAMKGMSLYLDMQSMSRGHIYINAFSLGRYWLKKYNNEFVQRYYYVPQDILEVDTNVIVVVDETGEGNPNKINLVYSNIQKSPCGPKYLRKLHTELVDSSMYDCIWT